MTGSSSNSIRPPVTGARWCLAVLIVTGLAIGIADAILVSEDMAPSGRAHQLWGFLYSWIAVLWVDLDSRGRTDILRPFDYTFLVFVFLPFYLSYYLYRTRKGWGILGVIGFGALYIFSTILSLVFY